MLNMFIYSWLSWSEQVEVYYYHDDVLCKTSCFRFKFILKFSLEIPNTIDIVNNIEYCKMYEYHD